MPDLDNNDYMLLTAIKPSKSDTGLVSAMTSPCSHWLVMEGKA